MKIQPRNLILAAAIALAIAPAAFAHESNTSVAAARQEAQISTSFMLSPYLRASELSVAVVDGKATLAGHVEEDVSKDLAKQLALGVEGITDVDNQIVVKADYVQPPRDGKPSYAQRVDDATITAAIRSKLAWNAQTHGMPAVVATDSGKVTLTGMVRTEEAKDLAGRLALDTRGVVSVENQLTLDGAEAVAEETAPSFEDAWITTKVNSSFMYSSNVDGSDIEVSTNEGVVTLTGKLESGAERALAIELAKNVRGVRSVESKGLTI